MTLTYSEAIAALARTEMQVEGRTVTLTPGMAVTAEIKTGSPQAIEYVLPPLSALRPRKHNLC